MWTDLLTDLDYKGRAYAIEDVPGDDTCYYAFVAYPSPALVGPLATSHIINSLMWRRNPDGHTVNTAAVGRWHPIKYLDRAQRLLDRFFLMCQKYIDSEPGVMPYRPGSVSG